MRYNPKIKLRHNTSQIKKRMNKILVQIKRHKDLFNTALWITPKDIRSKFLSMIYSNPLFKDMFLHNHTNSNTKYNIRDTGAFIIYVSKIINYANNILLTQFKYLNIGIHSPLKDSSWIELKPELFGILRPSIETLDNIGKELQATISHNNLLKTMITALKNAKLIRGTQLINRLENGVDAISTEIKNGKFIDIDNNEISNDQLVSYLTNAIIYKSSNEDELSSKYNNLDFSKRAKLWLSNIEYKNLSVDNFNLHRLFNRFINISDHPNSKTSMYNAFIVDFTLKNDTLDSISIALRDKWTLSTIVQLLLIKSDIYYLIHQFVYKSLANNRKVKASLDLSWRDWYGITLGHLLDSGEGVALRGNSFLSPSESKTIGLKVLMQTMYKCNYQNIKYFFLKNMIDEYELLDSKFNMIEATYLKCVQDGAYNSQNLQTIAEDFKKFKTKYFILIKRYFTTLTQKHKLVSKEDINTLLNANLSITEKRIALLDKAYSKKYFELKDEILNKDLEYFQLYDVMFSDEDEYVENKKSTNKSNTNNDISSDQQAKTKNKVR